MADTTTTSYLSIGEVLGLLLEEFPDVTISKIRFLESQGLISPERTASGYRKFYDDDVQLLRVILAEQRQNYLPLRVIKDRLETGEIDPTGEHLRPDGADDDHPADDPAAGEPSTGESSTGESSTGESSTGEPSTGEPSTGEPSTGEPSADAPPAATPSADEEVEPVPVPSTSIAAHPAARHAPSAEAADAAGHDTDAGQPTSGSAAQLLPGVLLDRTELCAMAGMTESELEQLESFGIIAPRDNTGPPIYGEDAVEIAGPACALLRSGVDARHLRNWRTSAEREASLYEQLITPRFRQRNPEARAEALEQLRELDELGGQLRAALTRHALRHHFDV